MKISVYAICKNEEKFAARWAASMQEADQVVVLDTGSTDGTVEQLRQAGVQVYERKLSPGGLMLPAMRRWRWWMTTRISASAQIWMRCSAALGGKRWNRSGSRMSTGCGAGLSGASNRMAPRDWSIGIPGFTAAMDSAGYIRCMRPLNVITLGGSWICRACSFCTMQTRRNRADNIFHCWSWRYRKSRIATAMFTIWAGNTSIMAAGMTALQRSNTIYRCQMPDGKRSGAPLCVILVRHFGKGRTPCSEMLVFNRRQAEAPDLREPWLGLPGVAMSRRTGS